MTFRKQIRKASRHYTHGDVRPFFHFLQRPHLRFSLLEHRPKPFRSSLDTFEGRPAQMLGDNHIFYYGAHESLRQLGHVISMRDDVVLDSLNDPCVALFEGDGVDPKLLWSGMGLVSEPLPYTGTRTAPSYWL